MLSALTRNHLLGVVVATSHFLSQRYVVKGMTLGVTHDYHGYF